MNIFGGYRLPYIGGLEDWRLSITYITANLRIYKTMHKSIRHRCRQHTWFWWQYVEAREHNSNKKNANRQCNPYSASWGFWRLNNACRRLSRANMPHAEDQLNRPLPWSSCVTSNSRAIRVSLDDKWPLSSIHVCGSIRLCKHIKLSGLLQEWRADDTYISR